MPETRQLSAVFVGPGRIELRDEAVPVPGPGEVRVRLEACGLCTFEQRLFTGATEAYPIVPGHEAVGVVDALGPGADPALGPGQAVAVAFFQRCRRCHACRSGQSHLCVRRGRRGADGVRRIGGLARYAVVDDWKLFELPAHAHPAQATLIEPLACVVHSLHQARLRFAEDVLVLGGGTMGQLHVALARLRGARVFLSEPDAEKRRAASAHVALDPARDDVVTAVRDLTEGRGADAVFVTHGRPETAAQARAAVRDGGRIVLYGAFPADTSIVVDPNRIHRQEVSYLGAANQRLSDWQEASRLLALGLVDVDPLVSSTWPLSALGEAMRHAVGESRFRTVIRCREGASWDA